MRLERPRRNLPTQQVWLSEFAVSALDPVRNHKTVFVLLICVCFSDMFRNYFYSVRSGAYLSIGCR